MKTLSIKDIVILGLMNFVLFVGGGNIIFPPFIGLRAGSEVWHAAIGFLLTGVGLPILASVAVARMEGTLADLTRPIGKKAGLVLAVVCYLCIGPLGAIPRTATVSYEMAIHPFSGGENWLWLYSLIYFALTMLVSLHPTRLLDIVGQILSPLKILALLILAIAALRIPMTTPGPPSADYVTEAFSQGVMNGYLTMDTLAALVFGLLIVNAIRSRGVESSRLIVRYAVLAGIVAGIGLTLVYLSLFRLGGESALLIPQASNGAQVLGAFVKYSFGVRGTLFLSVLIVLACLVTAIGLTCACGSYFSTMTHFSYRSLVFAFALFSMLVANLGLTQLIAVSVPVLTTIYPVFIVLIICSFFQERLFFAPLVVTPVVVLALVFGAVDACERSGLAVPSFITGLPLHALGLAWVLPSSGLLVLLAAIDHYRLRRHRDLA